MFLLVPAHPDCPGQNQCVCATHHLPMRAEYVCLPFKFLTVELTHVTVPAMLSHILDYACVIFLLQCNPISTLLILMMKIYIVVPAYGVIIVSRDVKFVFFPNSNFDH